MAQLNEKRLPGLLSDYIYTVPVVFCYVIDEENRVLLIKRKTRHRNRRLPSYGGKKEPGEDFASCCKTGGFGRNRPDAGSVRLRGVVNFRVQGRSYETVCFYFESRDFRARWFRARKATCSGAPSMKASLGRYQEYYRRITPFLLGCDRVFTGIIEVADKGGILRCDIRSDDAPPVKNLIVKDKRQKTRRFGF